MATPLLPGVSALRLGAGYIADRSEIRCSRRGAGDQGVPDPGGSPAGGAGPGALAPDTSAQPQTSADGEPAPATPGTAQPKGAAVNLSQEKIDRLLKDGRLDLTDEHYSGAAGASPPKNLAEAGDRLEQALRMGAS